MSFLVSFKTQYTLTGVNEKVNITTFAEIFDIQALGGISPFSQTAYNAWCVDSGIRLAPALNLQFNAYSSAELTDGLHPGALTSYTGPKAGGEQFFDSINWLLNQDYLGQSAANVLGSGFTGTITASDIQGAIWTMLGQPISSSIGTNGVQYNLATVNALANLAKVEGDGFVASAGQTQGIVIVDNYGGNLLQPLLIEVKAAQLGDYVWFDTNEDGIQDEGEVGIGGLAVKLLRDLDGNGVIAPDEVVAATTTDATGYYDFKGLMGGVEYKVLFDMQNSTNLNITLDGVTYTVADGNSFSLSPALMGGNIALDSNAQVQTIGSTQYFLSNGVTLQAGEFNRTIDAGFWAEGVGPQPDPLTAPGTGTPGFWGRNGLNFWDGVVGNERKTGGDFPHGELTPNADGILVGDFNRNGISNSTENTIFFTRDEALTLINSNQHKKTDLLGGEKGALMLGRAVTASWLNYLAGNSVDLANGSKDIREYLNDSITWLKAYQSGSIGSEALGSDPLGLGVTGNQLATILDDYNNGSAEFASGNFKR